MKIARLATQTGLFPVFEAEHGELVRRHTIRRPAPVRSTCASRAASRISSTARGTRRGPTSSTHFQAMADDNIAATGSYEPERGVTVMEKPFAITLEVGSSLANKTG